MEDAARNLAEGDQIFSEKTGSWHEVIKVVPVDRSGARWVGSGRLAAPVDKVKLTITRGETTFDFEVPPETMFTVRLGETRRAVLLSGLDVERTEWSG